MKNTTLLLLIGFGLSTGLRAQDGKETSEQKFERAEKAFSTVYHEGNAQQMTYAKEGYSVALPLLLDLNRQDPTNMNVAFKIGVCYLSSRRERLQSIPYFTKAITVTTDNYKGSSFKEKKAPFLAYQFLGDAYHLNYQFDKAIETYETYRKLLVAKEMDNKEVIKDIDRRIAMCKTGKALVAAPKKVKIQNLGKTVNSTFADYSPVLSADQQTMLFTSRRPGSTGGKLDDEGNYMEDIYMSMKTNTGWTQAVGIGSPINTDANEATVGISPDGQTILIYKDDNGDGNIYTTMLDGDTWTTPVKLNENINSKYWEPSACMSADGNTLYFVSNRPGGFGGRDLYTSKRSPEGDWSKAVNMGPTINTPFDEDAPFIHPDGVTLSFSSNGHNTMGGFDVFTSLLSDDGTWSEPLNVGYPINTTDDDIFYVLTPDNRKAYFTSFREGGVGEKDIYSVNFLDRKETALTLMKGIVNDESGKPAKDVMITVTDNETGEVVGVYHTNKKTGKFLFILTPGKNYNITYQAAKHLFYSENMDIPKQSNYYEINRAVNLNPIVVGSKIVLNNIFFDFDKATLRKASNVELKNLVLMLKSNPNLKVEISGHTDSKGDAAYNQKLSDERAQAVVASLEKAGIPADRMKAKGYGKTMPVAANQKANGTDNPDGRQQNRRVELKVTEMK
jgi:outer membrane protein OmpA-like peptidoglycan-associated protein